ncbi:MAG: hypothetical protein JXA96_14875 [Sedimentisphaerales bacterium]|nr:hypothetical protein [Sedimentisphaerales bacterium]
MKNSKKNKIATVLLISIFFTFSVSLWAAVSDPKGDISVLSQHIFDVASDLKDETSRPELDSAEINFLLEDMKDLLKDYENMLVFAESPYPGEILLGKTPRLNDSWHEVDCVTRYNGQFNEIRIRRSVGGARYLRINDIEITYMTPNGPVKQTLNRSGRAKLYSGDVFQLALPRPMKVIKMRIAVEHESNGLIITGVPTNIERPRPRSDRPRRTGQILLGTTPRGNDSWVETICTSTLRPVKEIQLKRTGRRSSYLRISDIEVTYRTPSGTKKMVFNKGGRERLFFDQTFSIVLPEPMRVTRIRILVEHETTGLQIYGII